MQLRPDLAINAMIKSLSDVVLPAVDEDDAPAREQLQIAIGLLSLLASRLPLEFAYDCDELGRLIDLAKELDAHAPDTPASQRLRERAQTAENVLEGARATPDTLQNSIRALRSASGAVVSTTYAQSNDANRAALSDVVLKHAHTQLLRERSWLLPQGWEQQNEQLPDVLELIGEPAGG